VSMSARTLTENDVLAPAEAAARPRTREVLAAPLVAFATLVAALICTAEAGVRFRDPDNVAALYFVLVGVGVVALVWLDVYVRAARETGTRRPTRAAQRAVRRARWTPHRMAAAGTALLSFYVAYLAYRNLKGVIPLLRPGDLFDRELADVDRAIFLGNDPAVLLHDLLGIGATTHVLSALYAAFIVFLPLSLGVALVFARDLSTSLLFATALSLNWLIGAGSYFLLPALGPVYADPSTFAALPYSEVTRLQDMLLDDRVGWLRDPATGTPQAIAAFASLHVAMSFTALAAAHLLGLGRRMKVALWAWMVVTLIATVYLGWHYVVDDVAGVAIGALSLALAWKLTDYGRAARTSGPSPPLRRSPR
jgi:membrane-associated phospholipid phosphatase